MTEKKILKWTNKMSKEEGYVKSVSKAKGYFINTFDNKEAKKYSTSAQVEKDLEILAQIGETENNDFCTVII